MGIKRNSFTDEDVERIAETLAQLDFKKDVRNRDDFDTLFDNYMGVNGIELREDEESRQRVFNNFVENFPDRITQPEDLKRTKEYEPIEKPKIKRYFKYLGKVGNQVVFLRKTFESREDRKQIVYRDRRGRIGKPKNPDKV